MKSLQAKYYPTLIYIQKQLSLILTIKMAQEAWTSQKLAGPPCLEAVDDGCMPPEKAQLIAAADLTSKLGGLELYAVYQPFVYPSKTGSDAPSCLY